MRSPIVVSPFNVSSWFFWSFVCNLMDMQKHLCTLLEIIQIATESGFWFCWATLEQKTQGVWKSNPPHGEDCVGDWWYCTKVPPSRCRERKRLGSNFKLLQVQLFRVFFSHFLLSFDHLEASTQASFSCSSSCLHLLSESKLTSCFHFLSLELQHCTNQWKIQPVLRKLVYIFLQTCQYRNWADAKRTSPIGPWNWLPSLLFHWTLVVHLRWGASSRLWQAI